MIYFLHAEGCGKVKIGYSADPVRRVEELAVSSPVPLCLLGTVEGDRTAETEFHAMLATDRMHGEWFRATPGLLSVIYRFLVDGGCPRTVGAELARRKYCRFGLRGVRVGIKDAHYDERYVHRTYWDKYSRLMLVTENADRSPESREHHLADDCYLLADWPIVCRCWVEESK
jgi:hypothetical protein